MNFSPGGFVSRNLCPFCKKDNFHPFFTFVCLKIIGIFRRTKSFGEKVMHCFYPTTCKRLPFFSLSVSYLLNFCVIFYFLFCINMFSNCLHVGFWQNFLVKFIPSLYSHKKQCSFCSEPYSYLISIPK